MDVDSRSGNTIRALERGFEIVEALREQGSLTLTELATHLELPTSTAHVYLKTLEQEGFVVRENRRYRNGLRFLTYGGDVRHQYEIYRATRTVLHELAFQTGERAGLGVVENGQRVLLELIDGTSAVSDNVPIGEFTEMHWTGLGKCLLAYLPSARADRIIEESELPRATSKTITDPDELRRELETIRERGYSIEDEDRREGVRCVAVPILDPDDAILGSIGLTGPTNRFGAQQLSTYVSLLESKANVVKLKTAYY